VRTLQAAGIAACGKHFPGHGDTGSDSHVELPVIEHLPERLRAVEFEPFKAAIAERVAFLMTAHVLVPAFDAERPATLAPAIVHALLREELGFDGVILSDDLEMKAVSAMYPVPEAAVAAIQAGCDGLLVCSGDVDLQARTLEALIHAVENNVIGAARLDDASRRLQRAKERFLSPSRPSLRQRQRTLRSIVGCEEHRLVADEMAAFQ
jgi:beta-N-acetylhexosaminidase